MLYQIIILHRMERSENQSHSVLPFQKRIRQMSVDKNRVQSRIPPPPIRHWGKDNKDGEGGDITPSGICGSDRVRGCPSVSNVSCPAERGANSWVKYHLSTIAVSFLFRKKRMSLSVEGIYWKRPAFFAVVFYGSTAQPPLLCTEKKD
jgi:hypothetical protein